MKFDQPHRLKLLAGAIAVALPFCAAQATDMLDSLKTLNKPPQAESRDVPPPPPALDTDTPPTGSSADHGTAGPQGPIRTEELDDHPASDRQSNDQPADQTPSATESEPSAPTWERVAP